MEYQQHKDRQAFKLNSQGLKVSKHILSFLSVKNEVELKHYLLGMGYLHSSLCVVYWGWGEGVNIALSIFG